SLGVSSPYYFSSAIIAATIFLGFGLDKYARPERSKKAEPTEAETQVAAEATSITKEKARSAMLLDLTHQESNGPRSGRQRRSWSKAQPTRGEHQQIEAQAREAGDS